jgi:hypothetical protein
VPSIRALLGPPIAPRPPGEPAPNRDIP